MGIFGALTNAVTGLRAQSYALENISGNIANSQTTGFKRIDTSFEDLIPDSQPNRQAAGSVLANSRGTNSVQGEIQTSSSGTFMAINGQGFFVVQKPSGFSDNNPVFEGDPRFTRRGDFQTNSQGYLVNGAGYYLSGIPIDPATGNPTGSVPQTLRFQNGYLPAVATTTLDYQANLANYPMTQNADPKIAGSELLNPASFSSDPRASGTGKVVGSDAAAFIKESLDGGAVTSYDQTGKPVNVQMRWAKVDSAARGGADSWEIFYQENSAATAAQVAWRNAGASFTFGPDGKMNPLVANITVPNVTVDGTALGNVKMSFGAGGLTQYSDTNGTVQVTQLQQNGYPAGQLQGIAVDGKGRLTGTYSNGRTVDLAQVTLADFNGPDGLKRLDGGAFSATADSGPPLYGAAGKVVGSALEGSNTDIADEFTKLIVTQQAYSANTRIVTTTNQMVQDLLNMLR